MIPFAEPHRLWWLAGVAAYAAAWWWRHRAAASRLRRFGDAALVAALVDPAVARRKWRMALAAAALAALVVAAARPQFGTKLTEVRRRGNDVFVAMDVSASMLAEDVPPSRLDKAKRALGLLIRSLKGDRVGVIAFAGDAFLHCPLTLDVEAAGLFLDSVGTGSAPVPGTSLGGPVRLALKHFPRDSRARRIVVLLTDGEDTRGSDPIEAARRAAKAGARIYTLGLGTPQGDVIKIRDESGALTGFKKDEKGETVLSRLDEGTLIGMSRESGGKYFRSTPDDREIIVLADEISSYAPQALGTKMYRVREERYQIFALLALLLLVAEFLVPLREGYYQAMWRNLRSARLPRLRDVPSLFRAGARRRRGPSRLAAIALAALGAAALAPAGGYADFKAHLKRGNAHYVKGRLEEARQEYFNAQAESPEAAEAPYNIGNTYYYEGEFEEALKFYDQADKLARSPQMKFLLAYNRGCALYRAGREDEAVEAFKQALRWNPADADAKYNLEWVRSPKRPRPKQQGQPQPKDGGKLSKEDAERLLEMARDKERQARQRQDAGKKEEEAKGVKDW